MIRILLIDDDQPLVSLLSEYLNREGFAVTAAGDGAAGVTEALSGQHSLVVLDVMMPALHGLELLRQVYEHAAGADADGTWRQRGSHCRPRTRCG